MNKYFVGSFIRSSQNLSLKSKILDREKVFHVNRSCDSQTLARKRQKVKKVIIKSRKKPRIRQNSAHGLTTQPLTINK